MELSLDLNPSDYAYAPGGLDVASTIALGHRLASVAPADLPAHAGVSLQGLRSAITLLERTYAAAQTQGPKLRRPIDLRTDNSWSCAESRLETWTFQEDEDAKEVAPAKELYRKLFPGGSLSFLQLDFNAQWAEANWRIELLQREQHLLPLLRRLIGDFFVDQLLFWHERYTAMLGINAQGSAGVPAKATKKPKSGKAQKSAADQAGNKDPSSELASDLAVGEVRRRAQQAIVAWQLTLVTLHIAGHKGARAALRPTDEFRERAQAAPRSATDPTPASPPPAAPTEAPASTDS